MRPRSHVHAFTTCCIIKRYSHDLLHIFRTTEQPTLRNELLIRLAAATKTDVFSFYRRLRWMVVEEKMLTGWFRRMSWLNGLFEPRLTSALDRTVW